MAHTEPMEFNMKTINLTKDYRFTTTEPTDEGFGYELILTEEDNQVTLRRIDSEFEQVEYIGAQGVLPVLKELVSGIDYYYSHDCYELVDLYKSALNVLVYKLFSHEEFKHLKQVFDVNSIVDLIKIMLAKGKLDYLKD